LIVTPFADNDDAVKIALALETMCFAYSPGARGSYPALRVKVFFFTDSGSPEGSLQFPGG